MSQLHFLGNDVQTNAADTRWRPGEVAIHEILIQTQGLEDLGAAVTLDRRNAHLRNHFDDPFVDGLDVVGDRFFSIDTGQQLTGRTDRADVSKAR